MTLKSAVVFQETEIVIINNELSLSIPTSQAAAGLTWDRTFAAGPEMCGGKGYNLDCITSGSVSLAAG